MDQRSTSQHPPVLSLAKAADGHGLSIAFQPIVDLGPGSVSGFEALARFGAHPPDMVFQAAEENGSRVALEMAAVRQALASLNLLPAGLYLSVNVSPDVLVHPAFERILQTVPPDRIVVEITEHAPVDDYALLGEVVERLHDRGVRLAIDDVGAGFSSLSHILRLKPDVMKLDVSFIRGIHEDPARRMLVASLVAFAHGMNITVVAEGIECGEEAIAMLELGVDRGQGFLYGRPSAEPSRGPEHPLGRLDRKALSHGSTPTWGMATQMSMLVERARTERERPQRKRAFRRVGVMLAATMIVSLLLGAGAAAASAGAPAGSSLWRLGIALEEVRLAVARHPDARIRLHAEFGSRRLEELALLSERAVGRDLVARRLSTHLEALGDSIFSSAPRLSDLRGDMQRAWPEVESALRAAACRGGRGECPLLAKLAKRFEKASGGHAERKDDPEGRRRETAGSTGKDKRESRTRPGAPDRQGHKVPDGGPQERGNPPGVDVPSSVAKVAKAAEDALLDK